jgi:hypothetical protein
MNHRMIDNLLWFMGGAVALTAVLLVVAETQAHEPEQDQKAQQQIVEELQDIERELGKIRREME